MNDPRPPIHVAYFSNSYDKVPRQRTVTWEKFCARLSDRIDRGSKDGLLFSPVLYKPETTRAAVNVEMVSCFVAEFDKGAKPEDFEPSWARWEYYLYSTFSHTPELPKWRVVFPFSSAILAEDWTLVWQKLFLHLCNEQGDSSCSDSSRMYYVPANKPDAETLDVLHQGEWLDHTIFTYTPPIPAQPKFTRPPAVDGKRASVDVMLRQALGRTGEGRNQAGFDLSCQLRDNGYSRSEAEDVLREFASLVPSVSAGGKIEAYTEKEALSSVKQAFSRAPREPWSAPRTARLTAGGVTEPEAFPCFSALAGAKADLRVPKGAEREILFALTSQFRGQITSPDFASFGIRCVNSQRCDAPLGDDDLEDLFSRAWASDHPHPHCDLIQKANLCPVLLRGEVCSAFKKGEKAAQEKRDSLAAASDSLTITPMRVMRTDPPIYMLTIRGEWTQFTHEQIASLVLFKRHVMCTHDFIPEIPAIYVDKKRLSDSRAWEVIVNEAMKTMDEEEAPPDDASPRGVVWSEIRAFLTEGSLSEERVDLRKGRVVLSEVSGRDCYLFKGASLRRYLKLNRVEDLRTGQIWKLIADRGGKSQAVDVPGQDPPRNKERAYVIPVDAFEESFSEAESNAETW